MKEFSIKNIIEDFPDPIAILDGSGFLRYLNTQFVKSIGFGYFELMSIDFLGFFKPRMSGNSFDSFYQFFQDIEQEELEIPHFGFELASGQKRHFLLRANKVSFSENVYVIIQLRDVESKILLETAELEHLKTLDDALFKLSHGVRHPVSLCLGLIDLLESPEELTVEEIRTFLDYFKGAVQDIDEEIREMNTFLAKNKRLLQKISE
ncbi:PAS domain S-box protein [Algoriphagus sp. CAU 1675]|uniref:PAS domain S-box protein n=1 Tax=Algoriphagus sp. CAU 1675 TaxID=3032597 RepID=UPI0023DAAB38|nr:PAS domain S-box protein [Algoriphagus sp. CAU 1675]MDF2159105.1 PAS domain S-box protein [Algoriphagus sp. CAU 1675]